MVPTAVLVQSPITTLVMSSTTNNNHLSFIADDNSLNPSGISVFPQNSSTPSSDSHGFDVYLLTTVVASDSTIRTVVLILISDPHLYKALIAKLFFC